MREVMTRKPDTIDADAPVANAIRAMDEFSYRYLPVLDVAAASVSSRPAIYRSATCSR